LFFVHVS